MEILCLLNEFKRIESWWMKNYGVKAGLFRAQHIGTDRVLGEKLFTGLFHRETATADALMSLSLSRCFAFIITDLLACVIFHSMSQSITIPMFGAASSGQQQQQQGQQQNTAAPSSDDVDWTQHMDHPAGGDGDMDFDLLAEYLLEENPGQASGMGFDFG